MRHLRFAAFAVAYAAAIVVARTTVPSGATLALFWPASGVGALWAITSSRRSELRSSALAIAIISATGNFVSGTPLASALVLGFANAMISHVTASVVRRGGARDRGGEPQLTGLGDFYRLLWAAAVASTVSLAPGMAALWMTGTHPTVADALAWVLRHAAAIVVVVGTAAAVTTTALPRRPTPRAEVAALFGVTLVVEWLVFAPGHRLPLEFVPFVLVFVSGVRLPVRVAAVHSAVVGLVTLVLVAGFEGGPLGAIADPARRAITAQLFMLLVTSSGIVLSLAWTERERLARDLAASEAAARARAEEIAAVTNTIPDGLLVIHRDGRILLHNEAAEELLASAADATSPARPTAGRPTAERPTAERSHEPPVLRPEMISKHHLDGSELAPHERPSVRALAGEHVRDVVARTGRHTPGSRIYLISATPLYDSVGATGPADRAVMLFRDITLEHTRMIELDAARQRAERLFEDAPNGVLVVGLDGTVEQLNSAAAGILGQEPGDLVGRPLAELATDPQMVLEHLALTAWHRRTQRSIDWTVRGGANAGVRVAMSTRVLSGPDETADVILAHLVDVTDRHSYEERLVHLADHDSLTGLPNRRRFDRLLSEHLACAGRDGHRGAMLLLDLDNFKEVNDTLGHRAGDELLISVAALLAALVHPGDLVARLGGDEFAILLPDADRAGAAKVARQIVAVLREHTSSLPGPNRRVTASIGVVTFAAAAEHDAEPLALADMLLYDAKDAGRDRFTLLDDHGRGQPRTGARLAWRARLEAALEAGAFELHLQPIMDLRSNEVNSAEALLRLTDVPGEPVSPDEFMKVAEYTGLAPALDVWVLGQSVELLALLRGHRPDFHLEVNLSAHSLGDVNVERALARALRDHRVDPSALILEITETAAVSDLSTARRFAQRVTRLGARFALDDFGAGYGSFYYLKHLPFDFVKIDGEFVARADRSPVDRAILRAIAKISRELGKKTIAEFVVNEPVLDVVRAEGIDFAQGYAVGRPVPAAEFCDTWLAARSRRA